MLSGNLRVDHEDVLPLCMVMLVTRLDITDIYRTGMRNNAPGLTLENSDLQPSEMYFSASWEINGVCEHHVVSQ